MTVEKEEPKLTARQLVERARRLVAARPRRARIETEPTPAQQRWAEIKATPTMHRGRLVIGQRKAAPKKQLTAAETRARRSSTRSSRARRDRAAALNTHE